MKIYIIRSGSKTCCGNSADIQWKVHHHSPGARAQWYGICFTVNTKELLKQNDFLDLPLREFISVFWRTWVVVLAPFLLSPVILLSPDEPQTIEALKCAYLILLMAVYWMTEALPLPITSMIPMVLHLLHLYLFSDSYAEFSTLTLHSIMFLNLYFIKLIELRISFKFWMAHKILNLICQYIISSSIFL